MKRLIIAAALASTTIAGIAAAQNAAPAAQPTATSTAHGAAKRGMMLDQNKDGVITRAEVIAVANERFAKLDKNGDGKISGDERPGRRGATKPDMTREQLQQKMLASFDAADANKDGKIDQNERQSMRGDRGRKGHGMRHGGQFGGGEMRQLMKADANRDGVVTKAEATAAAQAMFDRFDTNRDGKIDQAERDAARDKTRRGPARANTGAPAGTQR